MMDWDEIQKEATAMLVRFIQTNTSNPPGNEMDLIQEIEEICKKEGLHVRSFQTHDRRGNVMISLDESFESEIVFLSHLDVVAADERFWKHDPFAGVLDEGMIWGRGALDTKQLTVMQLMTMILLKRENRTDRNIVMIATADEEKGSEFGLKQLLIEESDLFQNRDVLSEGGGFPIRFNGHVLYLCECGQKGNGHLKIWFEKKRGQNPYYHTNEQLKSCAKLIQKIGGDRWETPVPHDTVKLMDRLYCLAGSNEEKDAAIDKKMKRIEESASENMRSFFHAMTQNTFSITRYQGGKRSADEEACSFEIDMRTLPGVTREMVEKKLEDLLEGTDAKVEIIRFSEGFTSRSDTPLFQKFEKELEREVPGTILLPFVSIGGSDGRLLQPYDARVYGFSPTLPTETFDEVIPMVHGHNERISEASLLFGIKIIYRSVRDA